MAYKDVYLRELCLELVQGNVGGERFNDLLVKTGIFLDESEWMMTNRLLEKCEQTDHLMLLSTASIH